MTINLHRKNY